MSPELWTPGMIGPLDDLVTRIHRRIDGFKVDHGLDKVTVSIELSTVRCTSSHRISPEPGYGFVTLCALSPRTASRRS